MFLFLYFHYKYIYIIQLAITNRCALSPRQTNYATNDAWCSYIRSTESVFFFSFNTEAHLDCTKVRAAQASSQPKEPKASAWLHVNILISSFYFMTHGARSRAATLQKNIVLKHYSIIWVEYEWSLEQRTADNSDMRLP